MAKFSHNCNYLFSCVIVITIEIPLPNEQARYEILKIHASGITKHGDVGEFLLPTFVTMVTHTTVTTLVTIVTMCHFNYACCHSYIMFTVYVQIFCGM